MFTSEHKNKIICYMKSKIPPALEDVFLHQ